MTVCMYASINRTSRRKRSAHAKYNALDGVRKGMVFQVRSRQVSFQKDGRRVAYSQRRALMLLVLTTQTQEADPS